MGVTPNLNPPPSGCPAVRCDDDLLRVGPPHSGRVAGRRSWVALGVEGRPSVDGVLADEVAELVAGDAEVLAHFVETDAAPQQLVDSASPGSYLDSCGTSRLTPRNLAMSSAV